MLNSVYDAILNKKEENLFYLAKIFSIDPLTVILDGDTVKIPCSSSISLTDAHEGSRVILLRLNKQYIIVGAITEEAKTVTKDDFDKHFDATPEDNVHGLLSGGFIIEDSGSNDNGSYVRWSNGLQVCWHTATYTYPELTAGEHTKTWTLPKSFVDSLYLFSVNLTTTPGDATRGSVTGQRVHSRSASSAEYYLSITKNFGSAASVELFAIGWWKELEES